MKKALIVVLLCVFVFSLVGTVVAANNCKKLPCLAQVFPDGSKYICCDFRPAGDHCVVIENKCYWEY